MNTNFTYIFITLFILSLINERIANWLKLALHDPDSKWMKKIAGILTASKAPGNLRLKEKDPNLEKRREKKILILNLWTGVLLAIILKADLIGLLGIVKGRESTIGLLGWQHYDLYEEPILAVLLGCIATGVFISVGSKFWHDLLDLFLQAKNYRRALTEKETYHIESVKNLEEAIHYAPAAKVRFAIQQNQHLKTNNANVLDITLGSLKVGDTRVASADVHLSDADDSKIPDTLKGRLPGGTEFTVPVKKVKNVPHATISASNGDAICNTLYSNYTGTLGCLLKDTTDQQIYALTCCHIMTQGNYLDFGPGSCMSGMTLQDQQSNEITIGDVNVQMDTSYDLAWATLQNQAQQADATLQPARAIGDHDIIAATAVKFTGAVNANATGIIINNECDRPMTYSNSKTVTLTNLILVGREIGSDAYECISDKGDSGALVLTDKNEPIGIVVGDSPAFTYVMPLQPFLQNNNKTIF